MIKKQPSREIINSSQNNSSLKNTQNSQKQHGLHESPSTKKLFQKGVDIPEFERPFHSRRQSRLNQNPNQMEDSMEKTEKTVHLHQRLKNLHLFYKNKIEEEKRQTLQRNNSFLAIIQELKVSHQEKVESLKKMIEEAEGEKKDVGDVDEKMGDIKGSIDEILKQSTQLKASNQRLQRQINAKEMILRQKEEELTKLQQELVQSRNELQSFELLNLKENKRNKQIISIIDHKGRNAEQ